MKCEKCGAEMAETASFCSQCGTALGPKPAASEPASATERFRAEVEVRKGEADRNEELWRGRYSPKAMMGGWLLSLLVSAVGIGIGFSAGLERLGWTILASLIGLVWLYHLWLYAVRTIGVRYILTTQRFYHEEGIIRHKTHRIEVIDMDDIASEQHVFEWLFGVGTIRITSSDKTHPELTIRGIEDPKSVASLLDKARRQERIRRGIHIEAV